MCLLIENSRHRVKLPRPFSISVLFDILFQFSVALSKSISQLKTDVPADSLFLKNFTQVESVLSLTLLFSSELRNNLPLQAVKMDVRASDNRLGGARDKL